MTPRSPNGHERYRLGEEIGTGGIGQVFRAFDHVLGREVALKCVRAGLQDEATARAFAREMTITAQLQHPSIIPVYDAGFFPDGKQYFAMRLVEGQTLDTAIEHGASLQDRLALVPSVRRACEAIAFAHGKSVVHLDLVPTNVLIGPFGETVVLNWRMAQRLDEGMTLPDGARADVHGLGEILGKLVSDVDDGGRTELLADLRAVAQRATAPDPEVRYPDAAGLCEDLRRIEAGQRVGAREYSLRSRARRLVRRHRAAIALSAGFVVVGAAAGIGAAAWMRSDAQAPCTGARAALANVWDPEQRSEVERAITGVERPYARLAWTRTEAALDDYAEAWVQMHTAACEATASGAQSSALLDRRMACLDRAAAALRATIEVLSDADAEVVERVDGIVDGLQPISQCADMTTLQADVPPPNPEHAEAVDQSRRLLAKVGVLRDAARLGDAQRILDDAEAALAGVEYPSVRTELALSQGKLAYTRGDNEAADVAFVEVIRRGSELGQWDEVSDALSWGMLVLGNRLMKPAEALRYRDLAEGLVQGNGFAEGTFKYHLATVLHAAGDYSGADVAARESLAIRQARGDALGVGSVRRLLGGIFMALGKPEEAERELRAAVEVRMQRLGPDHPIVANTRSSLANALVAQGKLSEAEGEARAALKTSRATVAPGHELIAAAHVALGNILADQGKDTEAEAEYRAALVAFEAKLGPAHPRVAIIQNNLGNLLWSRGKGAEAEEAFRGAFETFEKALGPDHPNTVTVRVGIGNALHLQGKLEEAEAQMRAVLTARAASLAPDHPKLGLAHTNLASVLVSAERLEEAESEYRAGLTIIKADMSPVQPDLVRVRTELAELLLRRSKLREGVQLAESAWSASQGQDFPVEVRARTAFVLAQLLWEHDRGQRPRAVELAQDALTTCEGCVELAEQLEAWRASHPAP